jgi:hypothetical protein
MPYIIAAATIAAITAAGLRIVAATAGLPI